MDKAGLRFKTYGLAAILFLLVGALIVFPFSNLFLFGPFRGRLVDLRNISAAIEVLALLAACLVVSRIKAGKTARIVLLLVLGALYLRQQNIDAALLMTLLYVESMVAIGSAALMRWRTKLADNGQWILAVLCGLAISAILIAVLSALHLAYPIYCFVAIVALGVVAAWMSGYRPLCLRAALAILDEDRAITAIHLVAYVALLVMLAKANLVTDYDSLWYGLRTQYVLAQGGSIFANLGLSCYVFYYPKLYETLVLPLSFYGLTGIVACFNVIFVAILFAFTYQLLLQCGIGRRLAALAALAVLLTPCVSGTVLIVKPDFLTALILFVMLFYVVRFATDPNLDDALVVLGALSLALTGKLTSIPYGGILFLGFAAAAVAVLVRGRTGLRDLVAHGVSHGAVVFVSALAVFAALAYRTFVLIGLPYAEPGSIADLFVDAGFHTHLPYAEMAHDISYWHVRFEDLAHVVNLVFQPAVLPHILMLWPGSLYVFTLSVAVLCMAAWWGNRKLRLAMLLAVGTLLFAFWSCAFYGPDPGGDGNYYVFPIMAVTALSVASFEFLGQGIKKSALALLFVLLFFNACAGFLATPEWQTGVAQAGPVFTSSPLQGREDHLQSLHMIGVSSIADALQAASVAGHCTALSTGYESDLFLLPCAVENERWLAFLTTDYSKDAPTLSSYITDAHYDFLIRPNNAASNLFSLVFDAYAALPGVRKIDDVTYEALDLRGAGGRQPAFTAGAGESAGAPGIDLVKLFSDSQVSHSTESGEPWRRTDVAGPDVRKYVEGKSIVIRTGAAVSFPIYLAGANCPAQFDFRVGLLPFDQVRARVSGGLTVQVINSGSVMQSDTVTVPARGFVKLQLPLKGCGITQQSFLRLALGAGKQGASASAVIAEPEIQPR